MKTKCVLIFLIVLSTVVLTLSCEQKQNYGNLLLPNERVLAPSPKAYNSLQPDEKVDIRANEAEQRMEIFATGPKGERILTTRKYSEFKDHGKNWWQQSWGRPSAHFRWWIADDGELERFRYTSGMLTALGVYAVGGSYVVTGNEEYLLVAKEYPILDGKYKVAMPYVYSLVTGRIVKEFKPFDLLIRYYELLDKENVNDTFKAQGCTYIKPNSGQASPRYSALNTFVGIDQYVMFSACASDEILIEGFLDLETMTYTVDKINDKLSKELGNPLKDSKIVIRE